MITLNPGAVDALEYLRKTVPGGFVLSERVQTMICEEARKIGWQPPKAAPHVRGWTLTGILKLSCAF
jgi:hypothetical protein